MNERFAICIEPGDYSDVSLVRWKVYPVLETADKHNMIRVVDESGEDYLYPADWFSMVDLPETVASLYRRQADERISG